MSQLKRRISIFLTCIYLIPHASTATAGAREEPVPLSLAVKSEQHFLPGSKLRMSPDGEWIAFVEVSEDPKQAGGARYSQTGVPAMGPSRTVVTALQVKTGRLIHLNGPKSWAWGPSWSPDGKRLAYYSDEDGQARVWLWSLGEAKSEPIPDFIARPFDRRETVVWAIDGSRILCNVLPENRTVSQANALESAPSAASMVPQIPFEKVPENTASVYVYASHTNDTDDIATTAGPSKTPEGSTADLATFDLGSHQLTRLTRDTIVGWYQLSADGRYAAFSAGSQIKGNEGEFELKLVDLSTNSVRGLQRHLRIDSRCAWAPDSQHLACVVPKESVGKGGDQIVIVTAAEGAATRVASNLTSVTKEPAGMVWASNTSLLVVGTDQPASERNSAKPAALDRIWRVTLGQSGASEMQSTPGQTVKGIYMASGLRSIGSTDSLWFVTERAVRSSNERVLGELHQISATGGSVRSLPISNSDIEPDLAPGRGVSIAYVSTTLQTPAQIWIVASDGRSARQLTHYGAEWGKYALGTAELIRYQDFEGRPLQAVLLLPPLYERERKLPLIVSVSGNPDDSATISNFGLLGEDGSYNMHVLATRGYAVLHPDMPLRTGRQFTDVLDTAMPAINAAIERGFVDSSRMAIMGHGIGSYSALALAFQSNRFKAVSIGGITIVPDLFSSYLFADPLSGDPFAYEQQPYNLPMGGNPWAFRERFIANSLAPHFKQLQAPLLMAQGSSDGLIISNVIYGSLKQLNKDVEYRVYENEDHAISRGPNIVDFWRRRIDFFDSKLDVARDSQGRMVFDGDRAKSRVEVVASSNKN